MAFSRYGQMVLVTHERSSRLLSIERLPDKRAAHVSERLLARFQAVPPALRRSLTFDNGTEFALHYRLTEQLGIDTFFCDPHAPWQKGGIENAIGRMRIACRAKRTWPSSPRPSSTSWLPPITTRQENALPSRPPTRPSPAS
jgi:IS30 family transposase